MTKLGVSLESVSSSSSSSFSYRIAQFEEILYFAREIQKKKKKRRVVQYPLLRSSDDVRLLLRSRIRVDHLVAERLFQQQHIDSTP